MTGAFAPDGRPVADVGPWARDKLALIREHIKISRSARRNYVDQTEATYIDSWCGPGLSKIRGTDDYLPGSPVEAYVAGIDSGVPFNRLLISDIKPERVDAAEARLKERGAPVVAYRKPADQAVDEVAAAVNPYSLHFAVLDPYNLDLPFFVIERLAELKRVDLMILLSTGDLQRNFRKDYVDPKHSTLDRLAPGWRQHIALSGADDEFLRQRVIEYWFTPLGQLRFATSPRMHAARNSKNVIMYWLIFASRSSTAKRNRRREERCDGVRVAAVRSAACECPGRSGPRARRVRAHPRNCLPVDGC
ncbi:MAG: three-Cys-motif partner protein TcmP [Burkholderiales bacterium]